MVTKPVFLTAHCGVNAYTDDKVGLTQTCVCYENGHRLHKWALCRFNWFSSLLLNLFAQTKILDTAQPSLRSSTESRTFASVRHAIAGVVSNDNSAGGNLT
jgi:hypothetical protein